MAAKSIGLNKEMISFAADTGLGNKLHQLAEKAGYRSRSDMLRSIVLEQTRALEASLRAAGETALLGLFILGMAAFVSGVIAMLLAFQLRPDEQLPLIGMSLMVIAYSAHDALRRVK